MLRTISVPPVRGVFEKLPQGGLSALR